MDIQETSLDTHSTYKNLITGGFSEKQAEALVKAVSVNTHNLATKDDIALLRNDIGLSESGMRKDMSNLEGSLRQDMKLLESSLRKEFAESKSDLLKFLFIQAISIIGVTVALIKFLQ